MRKVLEQCPSCGGKLSVTRMSCTACETVILGRYTPCSFCKLSPENLQFLETFIRHRGNVKEMERDLGQSYWTIRSKLNDVIETLGFEVPPDTPPVSNKKANPHQAEKRQEILEALNRGEISPTEATTMLNKLK